MQHHCSKNHRQSGKYGKKLCISQKSSSYPDRLALPLFHPATQSSRCWDEITSDVRWKQLTPAHHEPAKAQQESCASQEWWHWVWRWCQLAPSTKRRVLFYRFIYPFSFSWSSLICLRTDSLRICADSSKPWEESKEGRAWDISETTIPWVPISTPSTVWHFPREQLPDSG